MSPTVTRVSLDSNFISINDRKQTSNLTSSSVTKKFSIVSNNYHIWSLDLQCHGKHVIKFS